MSRYGRGINGVVVTAAGDGLESPRSTRTNIFGYFRLDDLAVGQTYVVSVESKRFVFDNPVRLVDLSGDLTDITFIASSP